MADVTNNEELRGRKLIGRGGGDIGEVEEIYLDRDTDRPQFARVSTGLLGRKSTLVPLVGLKVDEVRVWVDIDKESVKNAPTIDSMDEISSEQEQEIYRHYGVEHPESTVAAPGEQTSEQDRRAEQDPAAGQDRSPDSVTAETRPEAVPEGGHADDPEHERGVTHRQGDEEAEASREGEGAQAQPRLRRFTVTDEMEVKVPIQREEVRVEDPRSEPGEQEP